MCATSTFSRDRNKVLVFLIAKISLLQFLTYVTLLIIRDNFFYLSKCIIYLYIFVSINFNVAGSAVCCVSDKGTLHVWVWRAAWERVCATTAAPVTPTRALCGLRADSAVGK